MSSQAARLGEIAKQQESPVPALLASDEPLPFRVLNPEGKSPVLLLCDHASAFVPRALGGDLGLDRSELSRHIAYDIGIAGVTEELSRRLSAPAVLSHFSRLVIDPNRRPDVPSSIPEISDGTEVPANRALGEAERAARVESFFRPYHRVLTRMIEARLAAGLPVLLLSMHSFTPVWQGEKRPWQVGILWNRQPEFPEPLIAAFAAQGLCVGDNEPYTGRDHHGYTMFQHGDLRALPNALIELRQDLIDTHHGAAEMAERCEAAVRQALGDPRLARHLQGENQS